MSSGGENKLRLEVELALDAAKKQASTLEQLLAKAVQPKTKSYNFITTELNKANKLVLQLQSGMSSAFQTSGGAQRYSKEMDKLFESLNLVVGAFGQLKDTELLEATNSEQVKQLQTELVNLNKEIKEIEKHKIGNLFNGETKGFEDVRNFISGFSKDISKVSFSEFTTAMSKAMGQATEDIDKARQAVQNFQNQTNAVKMDNIAKVIADLDSAVNQVNDGIHKKSFTQSGASEVKKQIQELYAAQGLSTQLNNKTKDVTEKIGAGSSFADTVKEQTAVLSKALDEQRTTLETKKAALETAKKKIDEVLNKKTITTEDGTKLSGVEEKAAYIKNTILKQFSDIDFGEGFTKGSGLSKWASNIQNILTESANSIDVDKIKAQTLEKLKSIFDNADTENIIDSAGMIAKIKQSVESCFNNLNINISEKNNPVRQLLNSLKVGYSFDQFNKDLATAVQSMGSQYKEKSAELQKQLADFEQAKQRLTEINNTFTTTTNGQDQSLAEKRQASEELTSALTTLLSTLKQVTNEEVKQSTIDPSEKYRTARDAVIGYTDGLRVLERRQQALANVQSVITRWMGFYQVLNLTKRAIKDAANHIKELDSVMNKISIVTDMDTGDLWGQIDQYSKMAQTYGTSIKGAYEVSQIYYQQGLDTAEVLTLTNETLKLAKISGLDYAATTDYMTTAIRGFKMEMSEASTVVDVYSALAANTAVSQEELAVAMSKTASSMESVGSTFEETSAMIATMVAVTRESATNIGSAMKSIAARYGEMKSDPSKLIDSEGEALAFNKVDSALQSVGISMKTTEGQFREFTDVILELSDKWAELDSTQQRYIATQFAGNRQQSRFLALVSNGDLLRENINVAENSEDTGALQAQKALDSLESKLEQVKVAYQQFYTTIGIESVWKGFIDRTRSAIDTLNGMPKLFGKLPVAALASIGSIITLIKSLGLSLIKLIAPAIMQVTQQFKDAAPQVGKAGDTWVDKINAAVRARIGEFRKTGQLAGQNLAQGITEGQSLPANAPVGQSQSGISADQISNWESRTGKGSSRQARGQVKNEMLRAGVSSDITKKITRGGTEAAKAYALLRAQQQKTNESMKEGDEQTERTAGKFSKLTPHLQGIGSAFNLVALAIDTTTTGGKMLSAGMQGLGGALTTVGAIAEAAKNSFNSIPWVAIATGIIQVVSAIISFINANSPEAKLEEYTKKAEELNENAKELKSNYRTLEQGVQKYHKLEQARYDSAEAAEEYQEAVEDLADKYPALIQSYKINGEVILNVEAMERTLAEARDESAEATLRAVEAEGKRARQQKEVHKGELYRSNDTLNYYNGAFLSEYIQLDENDERFINDYSNSGDFGNLGEQISDKIRRINAAVESLNVDEIFSVNDELTELTSQYGVTLSENVQKELDKVLEAARAYRDDDRVIAASNVATISGTINKHYRNSNSTSALKDSDAISNAVIEAVTQQMADAGETVYDESKVLGYSKKIVSTLDKSWQNLTSDQLKVIEDMLSNSDNYTSADFQSIAEEYGIKIDDWLLELFTNKTIKNENAVKDKIDQMQKNESIDAKDASEMKKLLETGDTTLNQRTMLNSGLNQVAALKKQGSNTSKFVENFMKLYQGFAKIPAAARNALIAQFNNNGFSKEGLQNTLNYINSQNYDFDTSSITAGLQDMIDDTIPNITLAVDAMSSQFTDNLDGLNSLASDLQGGVKSGKLEKTLGEARQLGINLTRDDFISDGDKFIVKGERLEEELNRVKANYKAAFTKTSEQLDDAYQRLSKQGEEGLDIEAAQTIFGGDFTKFYNFDEESKKWKLNADYKAGGAKASEFWPEVHRHMEEAQQAVDNYYNFVDSAVAQMEKESQWDRGNYESLTTLGLESSNYSDKGAAYHRVRELAGGAQMTEEELAQPDVVNAVETYQNGMSQVMTDLSMYGAEYIKSRAKTYKGLTEVTVTQIARKVESGHLTLVGAIQQYAAQTGQTVAETNQQIVQALQQNGQIGAGENIASLISGGGFNANDLNNYLKQYSPQTSILDYIDESGNLKENTALSKVYNFDALTGQYTQNQDAGLDQILAAWQETFNVQIEEGTELYQQLVSDYINNLNKNDTGKNSAKVVSSILSGKVGDRIETTALPDEIEQQLGTDATHYYEITSEFARDTMILALDANAIDDAEWKAAVQDAQDKIRTKRSSYNGLKGIVSKSFGKDTAKTYLNSRGINTDELSDSDLQREMRDRGYQWDKYTNTFKATKDAIIFANEQINLAVEKGASPETIAELRTEASRLEHELSKKPQEEALLQLISNYENISDDILAQFEGQFGFDVDSFVTTNNGKKTVDLEGLREKLGEEWSAYFDDYLNQLADSYINDASKAASLVSSGTSSFTDMDAFTKSYNKLMNLEGENQKTSKDLFNYNALVDAWTLDPSSLQEIVKAQADNLVKEGKLNQKDVDGWIKSHTSTLLAKNVDISSFLSSEDKTAGSDAYKTLQQSMEQWYINMGTTITRAQELALSDIGYLQEGGTNAALTVQGWAQRQGREATASEIEEAFNNAINELNSAMDQLNDLAVGQITTGKLKEYLQKAGKADSYGVVTSVDDMTSVYLSIYEDMKNTAGNTVAGLNSSYAKVWDSSHQLQADAINLLENAMGMTADSLGEILSRYNVQLEDVLTNLDKYGLTDIGGGKIQISDFQKFADSMQWEVGSEEYINAYAEYNDSLIEYQKRTQENIKSEFEALGSIDLTQGDQQVNLTRIAQTEYGQQLPALAKQFGMTFKDGILSITQDSNYTGFVEALSQLGIEAGDLLESETQALLAQLRTQESANFQEAFKDIASNYNSISIEMISSLAKSLGMTFSEVEAWFENNGDGTYKTTLGQVQAIANKYSDRLSDATRENIENIVTSQYDTIISSFESTTSLATEGTTSMASMQEFASQFSELMGKQYAATDLFNYDAELNVFKLNSQYLTMYAKQQRAELEKLGLSGQAIDDYLHDSVETLLQQNIDIQSFLSATGKNQKAQTGKQLADAIQNLGNFDEIGLKATQMTYQQSDWRELSAAFDAEQLKQAYTENIMTVLSKGGESAVALVKQMKGKNATPEDLTAAYNAAMDPLRTATEDLTKGVGETVSGISINLMKAAGYKLAELDDGTAIIQQVSDSVEGMVAAYLAIYQQMQKTAGATQADLNNAYAKVLTANDQKRIDTLEALENASGMTYEAFGEILNQYGSNIGEEYGKSLEYVMAHQQDFGIESDGFGKVRITDFAQFAEKMQLNFDSPEYMEAYSNWVDNLIETRDNTVKQVFTEKVSDEISSLTEAKAGQSINVSYLRKSLDKVGVALEDVIKGYGVELENDILTINTGANIPGLIQAVAQEAAKAGAMLPEQMAELADTVSGMLSDIVSIIGNGIEGSMSNVEAQKLNGWYRDQQSQAGIKEENIKDLQFTRTADGLKLANSEATKLYNVIKDIDALQGEVVFDQLKDNLIATDDRFKDIQSTTKYAGDLTRKLQGAQMIKAGVKSGVGGSNGSVKMFDEMNGNVDLYNRNIIKRPDIGEDVYSTIETATLDSRNFETDIPWVMNITPIPPDAQTYKDIISQEELDTYVQDLMDGLELESDVPIETKIQAILDADKVENGGKGLIINLETAEEITDEIVESESDRAQVLHEVAALYEDIKAGEEFDTTKIDQYTEELALVQKIQNIRATTEDDSFKFMENDIPSGQNNPLNYFENWATAYEKMKESISGGKGKTGYMAYEDFYNIITEMGNIAELSGQAVDLGNETVSNAESAANLITKAAGALKVTSDGKLKVDLSSIGVDFKAGADQMNKDVNAGIKAVAQSQIDMLDSMIKMLEVVVAMESLGDIDVSGDNKIDLNEVFKIEYNEETGEEEIVAFTEKYAAWRQEIIDQITQDDGNDNFNEDLANAMGSVKIDGHTLAEMINWDFSDFNSMEQAKAFTDTLSALYTAALSDDFDIDNVADSVYKVLQQSGIDNAEIDVGETTFYINGGVTSKIDWSNEQVVNAAETAFDEYISSHKSLFTNLDENSTIKDKVRAIQNLLDEGEIDIESEKELRYQLALLTGDIQITENKDKKGNTQSYTGSYKGQRFTHASQEVVEEKIKEAIALESKGLNFRFEKIGDDIRVQGYKSIGGTEILLQKDKKTGEDTFNALGHKFKTLDEAIAYVVSEGYADQSMAGQIYTVDGETFQVQYDSQLGFTYAINTVDGSVEYKGKSFKSKELMFQYMQTVEPLLKDKKTKITKDKTKGEEYITNGSIKITRNLKTGELVYTDGKITFKDGKAFATYMAAQKIAESKNGTTVELPDGSKVIEYSTDNETVKLTVGTKGELLYEVSVAGVEGVNGFTARNETELKAGLATIAKIKGGTVTPQDGEQGGQVDFKLADGTTFALTFDANATVTSTATEGFAKEINDAATAAVPATLKADASGATTTIDASAATTTVTLPESISVDAITVTTPGVTVGLAEGVTPDVTSIAQAIHDALQAALDKLPVTPTINSPTGGNNDGGGSSSNTSSSSSSGSSSGGSIDVSAITAIQNAVNNIGTTSIENVKKAIDEISADKITALKTAADSISDTKIKALVTYSTSINTQNLLSAKTAINGISAAGAIAAKAAINSIKASITGASAGAILSVGVSVSSAKGTIGQLARAKGMQALAGGTPTLMGELGPELVVSQGRYFLAGQSGAEFVDLNKDAIVFNHKQTERLMSQGMVSSRGKPFTNETNAISFAKGNYNLFGPARSGGEDEEDTESGSSTGTTVKVVRYGWDNPYGEKWKSFNMGTISVGPSKAKGSSGPAMASASAALATLKQLREMWKSLREMSATDLAKLGSGGSGGGGGSGTSTDGSTQAEWIKMVDRWFNLTQKIAALEEEITHQEQLRTKLSSDINKNGVAYYNSQRASLSALEDQIKAQHELNLDRQNNLDQRIKYLTTGESPWATLFEFNKDLGKVQFKKNMMTWYRGVVGQDPVTGKAKMSNQQKYNAFKEKGLIVEGKPIFDSNGTEIKKSDYKDSNGKVDTDAYYYAVTQAIEEFIDTTLSDTDTLAETIKEGQNTELELLDARNEILNDIRDNQIEVEEAVLAAVEDTAQREIDELQETRDSMEESTSKYINGLQSALDKERDMYNRQNEDNELNKLYRKRAILQRSGGSASALASLDNEIAAKEQDSYFNKQQEQIDAIQEASDKQLERLDTQIEIMTETLEYQKEYGLLWGKVAEIMSGSANSIAGYIANNDSSNWNKSATSSTKDNTENLFKASQFTSMRDDNTSYNSSDMAKNTTNIHEAVAGTDEIEKRITNAAGNDLYNKEQGQTFNEKTGKLEKTTLWDPTASQWNDFNTTMQETGDITRPGSAIGSLEENIGQNIDYTSAQAEIGAQNALLAKVSIPKKPNGKDEIAVGNKKKKNWLTGKKMKITNGANTGKKKKAYFVRAIVKYKPKNSPYDLQLIGYSGGPESKVVAGDKNTAKELAFNEAVQSKNQYGDLVKDRLTKTQKDEFNKLLPNYKTAVKSAKDKKIELKFAYYKSGGMNYETGPAWLDGTPQQPEAVLNATQTRILRDDILGASPNSLMNLLVSFKNAYEGIGTTANSTANDNSIIIENATVNMNVSSIANDYDARRAGEQALSEMIRIARKTGAANSIRR